jgi:4-hydroxy-3-methylbut-2-enyl diphosphate reductase
MRVIRSETMGMCFGVRDALAILNGIEAPSEVTIHGELVHNEVVLHQLDGRGLRQTGESGSRLTESAIPNDRDC